MYNNKSFQNTIKVNDFPTHAAGKPAPTPQSHYQYQYNGERLKNNQEYQRIMKYE